MRISGDWSGLEGDMGACGGEESGRGHPLDQIAGRSDSIRSTRRALSEAARASSTLLLTGETGTGKGLAARAVHALSQRRSQPFVHLDCASLSPGVVESELFGHEKGAFTGASVRRIGRFERAGRGTILLDEIGDLPAPLQAKLLRVLQDREFERLGGTRTLPMRARILAATNRDLPVEVRSCRFRADLYFRLKVIHVRIPPLRERPGDAALLLDRALRELGRELGRPRPRIPRETWERFADYGWPGNVRELRNVAERMLVSSLPMWRPQDLRDVLEAPPPSPFMGEPGLPVSGGREDRERIAAALRGEDGNVASAARKLRMARSTLRYRIGKYRLEGGSGA